MKTEYLRTGKKRKAMLLLLDSRKIPLMIPLKGHMSLGRIDSSQQADILVASSITGRRHGEFFYSEEEDTYYYADNNSMNGTYLNGKKMEVTNKSGSQPVELHDGDVLRIDRRELKNAHPEAVVMIYSRTLKPDEKWERTQIGNTEEIKIGRGPNNHIRLADLAVSNEHALIHRDAEGVTIYDNHSSNGIIVNRRRINGRCHLYSKDVIQIGNTICIFSDNMFFHNYSNNVDEKSGCLSVNIRRKTVNFGRKTLIKDVRFSADSGDFILILGGSGAGKTTLINSILGDGKAEGEVILEGKNLYENFATMKSQIGLVPQFINLRLNDKVNQTLMDLADIKLDKRQFSKEDKKKRVDDIMVRLGIKGLENHLISQLSGGQKKKVSVAAQLVGFQKVFICDEPDSGLDAASRIQQMGILKEIADTNKIVMVISHEPDDAYDFENNEYLFTKVLVLAKSNKDNCGHLAYFGSPQGALENFGVNKLQEIMIKINPDYEGGQGLSDYYISKYNKAQRAKMKK